MVYDGQLGIGPTQVGPFPCGKDKTERGNTAQTYDAFAGFQDPSPIKSLLRNKSTIVTSFGQGDDDYQFALAIQESFKTLPRRFDVEEFELCEQNVPAQINPLESATVDEQAMSANPAVQETSALNLQTPCLIGKPTRKVATSVDIFMTGPVYIIFLLTELNSCHINVIAVWFMFITFLPMQPTVVKCWRHSCRPMLFTSLRRQNCLRTLQIDEPYIVNTT